MDQKRIYRKAPLEAHHEMIFENLGHILKQYREDNGITKEELNGQGFSRSLIDRIESGRVVTVHSLLRYLDFLQVEYRDLGVFMEIV